MATPKCLHTVGYTRLSKTGCINGQYELPAVLLADPPPHKMGMPLRFANCLRLLPTLPRTQPQYLTSRRASPPFETMQSLLRWGIENTDQSQDGSTPQPPPQPRHYDPELIDAILGKPDAVLMKVRNRSFTVVSEPFNQCELKRKLWLRPLTKAERKVTGLSLLIISKW
jgi:hypothetical protein